MIGVGRKGSGGACPGRYPQRTWDFVPQRAGDLRQLKAVRLHLEMEKND